LSAARCLRSLVRADDAGTRILFTFGLYAGGPAALWSSMLITSFIMIGVAASLAEICSAVPLSGSPSPFAHLTPQARSTSGPLRLAVVASGASSASSSPCGPRPCVSVFELG